MLGITLAPYGQIPGAFPYEIGYSYGGDGTFMCPDDDALYQTRGEMGLYHDSQLGLTVIPPPLGLLQRLATMMRRKKQLGSSVPSDTELAQVYGYTPVITGWVASKQGDVQTPWIPPNGWRPGPLNGIAGPQLRDTSTIPQAPIDPNVANVLSAMNEHNQKVFTLSIVTTLAIAVSAIVSIARNTRELRKESKLLRART